MYIYACVCIYSNPFHEQEVTQGQILGLNSEFSFSQTSRHS